MAAHLMMGDLDCDIWWEWIDSDSNPSDGLSRAGLQDAWTLLQEYVLHEVKDVNWEKVLTQWSLVKPAALDSARAS